MRLNAKVFVVIVGLLAGMTIGVNAVMAGDTVGAFEIDGNTPDSPAGGAIDWDTPPPNAPPNLTTFTDDSGDTQFAGGSKWNDQSTWGCPNTGSVQSKSNIVNGAISFRTISGEQFVYVNFTRVGNTGSANVDYEFNQGITPAATCPPLPERTVGDLVIAFDQDGNLPANVSLLRWAGTGFTELTSETIGNNWDGAVSADRRFGEAALNLSALLGSPIECGEFASVHMDSRSAPQTNSNMSDRTLTKPLNFAECPSSTLTKEVRNVTTGDASFGDSTDASPSDIVEYKFTYTNTGNGAATGVVVTDELPAGTTFVSGSGCSESSGTVTCNLGTVAGGSSASGTFQVQLPATFPQAENQIKNTGTATSNEEDPKTSNEATVNVTAAPDSELEKTARNDTTGGEAAADISASPGDQVTYTFTYTNTGTSPANNVTITDTVPTGTTFVSGNGCTNNAGAVTCSLGTVNPDDPKTVSFTVKLDDSFPAGQTVITNTGTVDTDEEPEENSNPSTVTVDAAPDLSLVKTASTEGPVGTGDQITYTLTYANDGNAPATGVVIDEPIPAGTEFVSCTGGCTTTGDPVTDASWDIGTVAADGGGSVTITVEVLATAGEQICNTATISSPDQGGGNPIESNQVCIGGENVASKLVKTAQNDTTGGAAAQDITADPGDQVTYSFTYTNEGTTPAHGVVITDQVPDHTTFVSGNGCVLGGDAVTVTCDLGTVAGGASETVTFTVELDSSFPAGETVIENTGVVTTDEEGETPSNPTTVTVNAAPDLSVTKSSNQTAVGAGGQITYTLVYANDGNADATDVVITEPIPADTSFVSCDPTCTETGDPVTSVTWDVGTVEAGGGGSVTLVVEVLNSVGCTVCNTATIESPDQDAGDPIDSNELCIGSAPGPNPAGANASGSATGVHIEQALLGLNTTLPANSDGGPPNTSVDSSQSGIGGDGEDRSVLSLAVPPPSGTILKADVVRASTVSSVTEQPPKSGALSVAETAGVNVLNGVVTADLVRAVAGAEATGDSTAFTTGPSGGSTFANLRVLGKAVKANVAPGTIIDLPDIAFGPDSYVKLMETTQTTSRPDAGQLQGGTYSADTTVTAIRVRISFPSKTDIIVSQAKAHADFPQTRLCEETTARQSVSGHAFTASEITNPPLLPILHGFVQIPATGGQSHQQLAEVAINDPQFLLLAKATETLAQGSLSPTSSDAFAYAAAADVCVLRTSPFTCLIQAGLVRSQANSRATAAGASSHDTFTTLGTLVVAGARVPINPARNTVIPLAGLGFVIINEQFCDNGAALPSCAGPTSTGLTVRSLRVVVTIPGNPFGLTPGLQLIVNEAHSDASFVP